MEFWLQRTSTHRSPRWGSPSRVGRRTSSGARKGRSLRLDSSAAVRTVAQGKKYVTPEMAQMLVDNLTTPAPEDAHQKLSDRELQTMVMIASGKRLSDIAEQLLLSPKTVSVYRARVLEKLGLTNNSELTVYAIRNGLV